MKQFKMKRYGHADHVVSIGTADKKCRKKKTGELIANSLQKQQTRLITLRD
jgi:hypothetical protein